MKTKILTAMLLAGTVVGCASNPPPPPPMAEAAPMPAPAAPAMGPMAGMYRGMADSSAQPRGCAKMTRPTNVRVASNNTFTLNGMRGMIGPDGAISSRASRGGSLSGTANAGALDVTMTRGKCSYHYTLNKA